MGLGFFALCAWLVSFGYLSQRLPDLFSRLPHSNASPLKGNSAAVDPSTTTSTASLRMNQIQVIGTHNSYHRENNFTEKPIFSLLMPARAEDFYYSHAPVRDQLTSQSVRSFEFDVWADGAGGRYAYPLIRKLTHGAMPPSPLLLEPGTAKVFHIADLDVRSTCATLTECLGHVKAWSDAHPAHVPIPIMLEFKTVDAQQRALGLIDSEPWNATNLDALDAEIRRVFPADRIVTPDVVRGDKSLSLEQNVLRYGWPTLESARGKVLFLMDNDDAGGVRGPYRAGGRENLEGRVVFTNSVPGEKDCAFMKMNDPRGALKAEIQQRVAEGYWVRTRADEPIGDAERGDTSRRDQALASGAQIVSTDFPWPGMTARYDSEYVAQLPGARVVRCNPISAPEACDDDDLE